MAKNFGPIRCNFTPWQDGSPPLIEFKSVTKMYGTFRAIDSLSLTIYSGEFFALLGPSGCGKTTLLRMLAGFETLTEGRILLDGEDLTAVPSYRRPVNMMFQSYALFPHMTVAKNIAFGLRQEGMPPDKIAARVDEMLAMVKLDQFAGRKPHQLSGGQRQRVALARSLAKKPKLLLLDEPLAALDKKLREETQFELMDIQEELGLTFVIVTHDQEEAMTVSSRIAVMDHGRMVQVATPSEIYEQPASVYVADFIGDINLIPVKIGRRDKGEYDLGAADLPQTIRCVESRSLSVGASAFFALRPEKLKITLDPPADPLVNCATGEVWDIGYVGDVSVIHVKLGSGLVFKGLMLNATRLVERPIGWGDTVWLSWDKDAGVILDK